jgi:hypothetical protein
VVIRLHPVAPLAGREAELRTRRIIALKSQLRQLLEAINEAER